MRRRVEDVQRPPDKLDSALATALAVLVVWAPLPLGSNRPWSWALLSSIVGLLLAIWAVGCLVRKARPRLGIMLWLAAACTLPVWAWAWLQTVPLADLPWFPASWAHPAWRDAADAGLSVAPMISLDGSAGREVLMRLMTYAAAFFLGCMLGHHPVLARRLLLGIVLAALVQAAWALVSQIAGLEYIWWNQPRGNLQALSGTFINRNHFSTFLNLGIVVAVGLALAPLVERSRKGEEETISRLVRVIEQRWPLLVVAVVLVSTSLASGSRGGALSLGLALLVLLALLVRQMRLGRTALFVSSVLILGTAWGIVQGLGGRLVVERVAEMDQSEDLGSGGRLAAWELSLDLLAERPWLGQGLGGYKAAFERVRDERFPRVFREAHNTYLEHAVELGLPATILLYLGALMPVVACVQGTSNGSRGRVIGRAVGICATILVATHSIVEFSLQIPAVALTFATILGVSYAGTLSTRRERRVAMDIRSGPS